MLSVAGHPPSTVTASSLTRARIAAGILYLLTVGIIVGLVFSAIRVDYHQAVHEAEMQTSTLVTALEEQVTWTVADTARVLGTVEQRISEHGGIASFSPGALSKLLREHAKAAGQLESLYIVRTDGVTAASSFDLPKTPLYLGDRQYFIYHRDHPGTDIYVGGRIISRLTGSPLFTVSIRIAKADGTFDGILSAAIETNYFRSFYDRLGLPANSSILIARRDGSLLFRHPESETVINGDDLSGLDLFRTHLPRANSGTFEVLGAFDNTPRIVAFRATTAQPFVVTLSIPRSVALQRWRMDAWRKSAFAGAMILLLSWFAAVLLRQLARIERAEARIKASQARFRELATLSNDGFWEQDAAHSFTWLGERLAGQIPGLSEMIAGKKPWELPVTNLSDADWAHHRRVLEATLPFRDFVLKLSLRGKTFWLNLSGNPVFDDSGFLTGYHGTMRDVTQDMEQRAEMTRRAFLDPLTRLPNRALLGDRLDRAIAASRRNQSAIALLFIDLDGFKSINDRHGHHVGDLLLKNVSALLQDTVREADTVSRIGGDEFVVLIQDISGKEDAEVVARKILDRVSEPQSIEGSSIQVTPSIGIALFPDHAADGDALLRAADEAMYAVKGAGRADFAFAGA